MGNLTKPVIGMIGLLSKVMVYWSPDGKQSKLIKFEQLGGVPSFLFRLPNSQSEGKSQVSRNAIPAFRIGDERYLLSRNIF